MKFILLMCILFTFTGCNQNHTISYEVEVITGYEQTYTPSQFENEDATQNQSSRRENEVAEVYIFGFESADAILITTENYVVMIDTGENQHRDYILRHLVGQNIYIIDYMIITHFDRNHVGGAHYLIRNLEVRNIIVPNYSRESRSVERFNEALLYTESTADVLTEKITISLDDAEFAIIPSHLNYFSFGGSDDILTDYEEDNAPITPLENDFSIVVHMTHGENNFLFTGDAMAERLSGLLEMEEITNVDFDFLKVPHHGRRNRRSEEFINTKNPRYAVITCCFERPADSRVIDALEYVGAQIFFTRYGGVLVISNRSSLVIEQ